MERELAPLPAPMASIIGRESDIAIVRGLVERDDVRLVTLTGPAGVGKTRLAIEVAWECGRAFDGRVSFVSLAELSDTSALLGVIASALGVPDSVEPIVGMRRHLRESTRLLVLDNLEQLAGAGRELVPLLKGVAGLTVLVTSRSSLEVYGEYLLPVDPLPLPAAGAEPRELSKNPAIQLLVDSARSANAAFAPFLSDFPVLAEITRRVDGLPLALELAGVSIPLLGPRGVLDRLGDKYVILAAEWHGLPERLQTMRTAVAWSYDLLTVEEQALFRRLSVFNGGFTLEMAEAMARGWQPSEGYPFFYGLPTPSPAMDVGREGPDLESGNWSPPALAALALNPISGLDSLVKQSLVRTVRSETGGERFQLLETMREFGLEQLALEGERDAAEHARAVLLMAIAEVSGLAMWGEAWRPAVAWMEAELPNIRAALVWLAGQPAEANQIALRLVEGLWLFWQSRGYVREGCAHLEACLARPGGRPVMRAHALNQLAALSWIRSDLPKATAALDEALPVYERSGFVPGEGRNFMIRALVAWTSGDFERMEKMAVIGKSRLDRADDRLGSAICSLLIGISARARGDRKRATESFTETYRGCLENPGGSFNWGMAIGQYFLGEMAREDGDRATAVGNIRQALEVFVDLGDPWTVGGCVGTLAIYLIEDGELEEAARLLGAAHGLESSYGLFLPPTETRVHEAAASELRQRIGPDSFIELFTEGEAWSMEEAGRRAMATPLESAAARAGRKNGNLPHPLFKKLTRTQQRTLRMLADGQTVKEIAFAEGRGDSSIYERIDAIRAAFGLPKETPLLALLRFVDRNEIL